MAELNNTKNNFGEFVRRYVDSVRRILSDPSAFFIHKADQSGYMEPTVFALISIMLPKLFYALLFAPFTFGLSLIIMVPAVVYQLGILVIASVILFGLIRLFKGRGDFEAAYRSMAYASTASLMWFAPVPFINLLMFAGLFGYLLYYALRETHGLNQQQTMIVLTVPLLFIFLIGAVFTLIATFLAAKGILFIFYLF